MAGLRTIVVLAAGLAAVNLAWGQTPAERREKLANMIPKHEAYLGALAPENLNKERPAPPFDLTGTWFVDLSRALRRFSLRPAVSRVHRPGEARLRGSASAAARSASPSATRSASASRPGIPMIMTRVWPIAMVQLPTVIMMVSNFNNSFRQIFLDGRP